MKDVKDSKYLGSCDSWFLWVLPVGVYAGRLGVQLHFLLQPDKVTPSVTLVGLSK